MQGITVEVLNCFVDLRGCLAQQAPLFNAEGNARFAGHQHIVLHVHLPDPHLHPALVVLYRNLQQDDRVVVVQC